MKTLYWLPRILSIGFVLFLSLFSLDVFSEYSGWSVLLPLFMHLIPSLVLLALVIVAWKYDLIGAIAFLGFAVFYVFMVGLNGQLSWYVGISGPAALVGILFLIHWLYKRKKVE